MLTAITHDIKISVETAFSREHFSGEDDRRYFAYRIRIENNSDKPVRLLRRHWYISDAATGSYEVEGEGVVGLQPTIIPGGSHTYVSGCMLFSDFGKMYGTYLMEWLPGHRTFEVNIPSFHLIVPERLN